MKTILVTSKKYGNTKAFVSDEDFDLVNRFKWSLKVYPSGSKYPRCNIWIDGKRNTIFMHKLLKPEFQIVDHHNNNGLDNRRENLREATKTQNNRNKPKNAVSSIYKGVCYFKGKGHKKKWLSKICVNYKQVYLGVHETEVLAAEAYNNAAIIYFGEFAKLNVINSN